MPTESSIWDVLNEFLVPKFEPTKTWENLKLLGLDPNEWFRQGTEQMSSPKAQAFGALDPMLGMIMSNFRTPEAIQQLRKVMAGEMKSRGPSPVFRWEQPEKGEMFFGSGLTPREILEKEPSGVHKILNEEKLDTKFTDYVFGLPTKEIAERYKDVRYVSPGRELRTISGQSLIPILEDDMGGILYGRTAPNPIDQILRGSWYHGMNQPARTSLIEDLPAETLDALFKRGIPSMEWGLDRATRTGFPISHHDALSVSNKLGEPSGVSLSMLPTKTQEFSADEFIHRVLPQYGGPPTERTVNLMTPEGRKMLNDAYDVVANRELATPFRTTEDRFISPIESIAETFNLQKRDFPNLTSHVELIDFLDKSHEWFNTSQFNQALSQQLQSQGKRGILYNPRRWNEYEMLMLDPKYVLPLDYRKVEEYVKPLLKRRYPASYSHPETLKTAQVFTPGTEKGFSQIENMMTQNKSRLEDVYSERPWVQRISDVNKHRLLQMIDEQYREAVGKQLFGG